MVEVREPTVSAKIVTPHEYVGAVMELCLGRRGGITEQSVLGQRTLLTFTLPLAELAGDFYPELKALTSG